MYCAYVTRIHNLRKHTNADRLLCGECFGNTVIVDLGTDPDQLGVYFPTDGKLGLEFAQKNDLLRRKDENGAPAGGYRAGSGGRLPLLFHPATRGHRNLSEAAG